MSIEENILKIDTLYLDFAYFKVVIRYGKEDIHMAKLSLLPFQDTYISEWYGSKNFGGNIALFLSQYLQAGDDYRSLMQFDFRSIPVTATIEKAVLELTMFRNEVKDIPITISVHRLLDSWHQFSVTWDNQPLSENLPDATLTIENTTPLGKIYIDITELVKGWYDGSIPNNGLILKGNEVMNDLIAFRSTNFADSNTWPLLHISYINGILETIDKEELIIPEYPPYAPLEASTPIPLGPRKQATFLVKNASESCNVEAIIQVGYSNDPNETFFNDGPWVSLKPDLYPGEAIALTTSASAEYARILVKGEGGEKVYVWARTYQD